MTMKPIKLALLALALTLPHAAYAGDSEDFAGCDGLKKPKSKDDGMRGEATVSRFGLNPFSSANTKAAQIVVACDKALSNPKLLPTQTVRRAHLLRARGAAKLQLKQHAAALADFDAAQTTFGNAPDPFAQRSMGVSLDLLRAIALYHLDRKDEAAALAAGAAQARPYAVQVQMAAAVLERRGRAPGAVSGPAWANLMKLEPRARQNMVGDAIASGDFASAVKLAKDHPLSWPDMNLFAAPAAFEERITAIVGAYSQTMQLAYAHAATGDAAGARAHVDAAKAKLAGTGGTTLPPELTVLIENKIVAPLARQVEARLALANGRVDDAAAILADPALVQTSATAELAKAYRAQAPTGASVIPEPAAALPDTAERDLSDLAELLLIKPESMRSVIDYKKSRPAVLSAILGAGLSMGTSLLGGVPRTSGFRSAANTDGTVKVEYTGGTTSGAMVQEMTLLRAAELAREAGKSHFVIEARTDYQQYLVMSQYGIEQSRTLSGYKTEMNVRFLDAAQAAPTAFDAVAVIDGLGPLYYDAPGAKDGRS